MLRLCTYLTSLREGHMAAISPIILELNLTVTGISACSPPPYNATKLKVAAYLWPLPLPLWGLRLQCDVLYLERWVHRVNGRCFNYTIACFFPKQCSVSSTNLCTVSNMSSLSSLLFIISLYLKRSQKSHSQSQLKDWKLIIKNYFDQPFFLSQD